MLDLDGIYKLALQATQGPWYGCVWDPMERPHVSLVDGPHHGNKDVAQNMRIDDAKYVGSLGPEVVMELIDRVRRAENALARLTEVDQRVSVGECMSIINAGLPEGRWTA